MPTGSETSSHRAGAGASPCRTRCTTNLCKTRARRWRGSAQRQAISRMVQGRWARTVFVIPGDRHVVTLSARVARREARPHGLLHHMGRRAILVYLALLPPSGHLAEAAGLANRAVTNICSRTAMTRTSSREELAGLDQRHPAWSRHFYSWKSTVTRPQGPGGPARAYRYRLALRRPYRYR